MLGMLSPASRGALMTAAIFLYVFMGLVAGYVSARLYKTIKGRKWKRAAFLVTMIHKLLKNCKMRQVLAVTLVLLNLIEFNY